MRTAAGAMWELCRRKPDRRAAQSDPEAIDQGERAEHIATLLLAGGLANPPPATGPTAERRTPPNPPSHPMIQIPSTRKLRLSRDTGSIWSSHLSIQNPVHRKLRHP